MDCVEKVDPTFSSFNAIQKIVIIIITIHCVSCS